jgi:hypothetical protein
VTADSDVVAYFRHVAGLAAALHSIDIYEQYRAHHDNDGDADFVMNAGLDCLLEDAALPAEQRRVIEQIKALHHETQQAKSAALEQLSREGKWQDDDEP